MSDLSAFAESVWIVEGPSVRDMGVMFTTRMTIVKLWTGSLWVDSPVSVPSETLKRITDLGPVGIWLRRHPGMSGGCQRGTRCFPRRSYGRHVPPHLP